MTLKLLVCLIGQFGRRRKRLALGLGLLLLAAFLSSCDAQEGETTGRLLLWHSLGERDAAVLDQILDRYEDLHPGMTVVRENIPVVEIVTQYERRVEEGLGPDMMLITDYRLVPLLAQGKIRDLSAYDIDLSAYDPLALDQAKYQEKIVGIPFSTFTQVLCYNRRQVTNPPTTLDQVMADAEAGYRFGLQASFSELAWTMPAIGGSFFNESNQVEIHEEELANWLAWLVKANEQPNIIINVDMGQLEEAFVVGELDFLVCPSEQIPDLQEALGQDTLGVAPLPAQPGNTAMAYFTTEIIIFSPAAAPDSIDQAVNLAKFLADPAQQTTLALETQSQIPVNLEVDIDSRLAPLEAVLLAQPKVAAPLDFTEWELLSLELAEPYIGRVLAGELEPAKAAYEITRRVNDLWRNQG